MGSFYGSIHVRTDDRPAVLDAAEAIARKGRARFLVSPVLRGWVTLFPNVSGQDESLSRTLARRRLRAIFRAPTQLLQRVVHPLPARKLAVRVYRSVSRGLTRK